MGRQLVFWKYEDGVCLDNKKVYQSICDDKTIPGLANLPVSEIKEKVKKAFSNFDMIDEKNFESANGSFTIYANSQTVIFDCSYSLLPDDLNKIIDIMLEYDCPYYDPQIEIRFDEN